MYYHSPFPHIMLLSSLSFSPTLYYPSFPSTHTLLSPPFLSHVPVYSFTLPFLYFLALSITYGPHAISVEDILPKLLWDVTLKGGQSDSGTLCIYLYYLGKSTSAHSFRKVSVYGMINDYQKEEFNL